LLIGCVLTKLKHEPSWVGDLHKDLAEIKHSESGGDTFLKREGEALNICLPHSVVKDLSYDLSVQCMALFFSQGRMLHLLSPGNRLQPSWSAQNS